MLIRACALIRLNMVTYLNDDDVIFYLVLYRENETKIMRMVNDSSPK